MTPDQSSNEEIWAGWQAGANLYVPNPFDPDQLTARLMSDEAIWRVHLTYDRPGGPWV